MRNRFTYYGIIPASDAQERPSDNFVFGKTSFTFDANHRVASRTVEGGVSGSSTANYTHNDDDYPTQIGSMALTYSYPSGRLSTTTIGNITDTRTYDTYGNLESYTAVWNPTTTTLYSYTLTRDDGGRIIEKSETIQGVTSLYEYTYDSAGRLTQVDKDSVTQSTFTYDNNSNRTSGTIDGVAFTATYDDQDRMLTFNSRNYTYNRNGELSKIEYSMGVESDYTYDVLGNLRQVDLSSGDVVVYGIDGLNRRATKSKNSAGIYRHIFEDQHRISAFVNGSGQLIRSYVYGTRLNVPDYLYIVSTSSTHKIITDHLGSPRLVVNVSNGTVNQRMDYNVLGYVTSDTNPGFTPFGFAGGIYDPDTKLVRFGARDYDTETGRWTAKDPIRFNGGDTNLYGYVLNDPVNFVDPNGQAPNGVCVAFFTVGVGAAATAAYGVPGLVYGPAAGFGIGLLVCPDDSKAKTCESKSGTSVESGGQSVGKP